MQSRSQTCIMLIPSPHTTALVTCITMFFQVLANFGCNSVNQLCKPIRGQNFKNFAIWSDGAVFTLVTKCCKNLEKYSTGDDSYWGLGMRCWTRSWDQRSHFWSDPQTLLFLVWFPNLTIPSLIPKPHCSWSDSQTSLFLVWFPNLTMQKIHIWKNSDSLPKRRIRQHSSNFNDILICCQIMSWLPHTFNLLKPNGYPMVCRYTILDLGCVYTCTHTHTHLQ